LHCNIGEKKSKSDLGYVSTLKRYRAQNCEGCPLRCKCHKSKNNRIIEVNYTLNPKQIKHFSRMMMTVTKTDTKDACMIGMYGKKQLTATKNRKSSLDALPTGIKAAWRP
jgi:hypothetical protein